jgi:hypothetical protein
VQPVRQWREWQRVAEHDVEREHAPQPIQAHQSPHVAQYRGRGLTSRECAVSFRDFALIINGIFRKSGFFKKAAISSTQG